MYLSPSQPPPPGPNTYLLAPHETRYTPNEIEPFPFPSLAIPLYHLVSALFFNFSGYGIPKVVLMSKLFQHLTASRRSSADAFHFLHGELEMFDGHVRTEIYIFVKSSLTHPAESSNFPSITLGFSFTSFSRGEICSIRQRITRKFAYLSRKLQTYENFRSNPSYNDK